MESEHLYQLQVNSKLKVGIQLNTEVTISSSRHRVTQVFCSALPLSYCNFDRSLCESFARLILEATYEATLYAALTNHNETGSNLVFLTLIGGGAFGNDESWIFESMQNALKKFKNIPIDVKIVSYGQSNEKVIRCINEI